MKNLVKTVIVGLSLLITAPMISNAQEYDYRTAEELGLMQGFPPAPDKRVTKANALLTAPFNRWSYQNMRLIYPSAPIPSADKAAAIEREINNGIDKVEVTHMKKGKVNMETYLKESFTDAIVVVKGDKIVYEKYLNGMNPDQPHQMMSVTKSFGGLLGLMAVEEGKLSEEDIVSEYVPELHKSGAFGDATFGQVLDMTNSMNFTEVYSDPMSGIRRYGAVLGWTEPVEGIEYEDNLYDYLVTLDIDENHPHGEIFHYQTPKTDVVNWVTNKVNGQSFQEALYEKVWSKIGTEGETYVLLDKNATLVAGGGLNATPNNLARFAMMMKDNGKFNGEQVVPQSVIEKLAEGGNIEAFDNGPDSDGIVHKKGEWSYRGQWWVKHTPGKEAFMAIGIHGQWIYIDVERDIAIVKQSSQPVSKDTVLNSLDLNAFDAIIDYLTK